MFFIRLLVNIRHLKTLQDIITKGSLIIFGIQIAIFIIPFTLEYTTDKAAILFFADFSFPYFIFFTGIWILLLIIIVYSFFKHDNKNKNYVYYPFLLSLIGLSLPIIILLWIVINMHPK